jgi:hypothetical protein
LLQQQQQQAKDQFGLFSGAPGQAGMSEAMMMAMAMANGNPLLMEQYLKQFESMLPGPVLSTGQPQPQPQQQPQQQKPPAQPQLQQPQQQARMSTSMSKHNKKRKNFPLGLFQTS